MDNLIVFVLGGATVFIPVILYMLARGHIKIDFSRGIQIRYSQEYLDMWDEARAEVEEEEREESRRAEWNKRYRK